MDTDKSCQPLIPLTDSTITLVDLIHAPESDERVVQKRDSWDKEKPATAFTTPERLPDGGLCNAGTVILRTKGCHWFWSAGCTFCGYFNDTREDITADNLFSQWEESKRMIDDFNNVQMVKVYTSGSFLEDREIPVEFQQRVLEECAEKNLHLVIESRTEQLTSDKLEWVTSIHPNTTVAIGLEAYDDDVLAHHVNKGFSTKQWHRAVSNLKNTGLRTKTYLVFKPPFMSEGDALSGCIDWVKQTAPHSDEISVNPLNIQRGTIPDRLFYRGEYRPPWLWSMVSMIEESHQFLNKEDGGVCRLIVHPTGGGSIRGSHNCGKCDKEVVGALERYSVSGDLREFSQLDCPCRNEWATEVAIDQSLPIPFGCGVHRRGLRKDALRAP